MPRVLSLVRSRCLLGFRRAIYLPGVFPRGVSTVLEGDRVTTTSAECEAVSHVLTLGLSSGELWAELLRCCTEVDHVSTKGSDSHLRVAPYETLLTFLRTYGLITPCKIDCAPAPAPPAPRRRHRRRVVVVDSRAFDVPSDNLTRLLLPILRSCC